MFFQSDEGSSNVNFSFHQGFSCLPMSTEHNEGLEHEKHMEITIGEKGKEEST